MKKIEKFGHEYYSIYHRDYDAKKLEIKNAPRFREYIRLLLECYETGETIAQVTKRKYTKKFNKKHGK